MPDYTMPFGRYNNQNISMVPRSYLNWCQENLIDNPDAWLKSIDQESLDEAIEVELAKRDRSHVTF